MFFGLKCLHDISKRQTIASVCLKVFLIDNEIWKWQFGHNLCTLMSFQMCITFSLLWNTKIYFEEHWSPNRIGPHWLSLCGQKHRFRTWWEWVNHDRWCVRNRVGTTFEFVLTLRPLEKYVLYRMNVGIRSGTKHLPIRYYHDKWVPIRYKNCDSKSFAIRYYYSMYCKFCLLFQL